MARRRRKPPPLSLDKMLRAYYGSAQLGLGPKGQRREARRTANLSIQDQLRGLASEGGRERTQALRQAASMDVASQVVAQRRQSDAEATAAAYGQLQQQLGGANQSLIEAVQAAQQRAVTAGQQASEASAGFTGDIGTEAPGRNARVARQTGVTIPGEMLATQGLAASTRALEKGQAVAAGLSQGGQATLQGALRDITEKYGGARRDVLATRPKLIQETLAEKNAQRRADFSTMINALYLKNTMGKTAADIALGRGNLKVDIRNAKTAAAKAAAAAANARERAAIARMNAVTSRQRANIAKQQLKLDETAAAGDFVKVEQDFRKHAHDFAAKIINVDRKRGVPRKQPPSKKRLMLSIYSQFGRPLAGKYGLTEAELRQWAAQVVNAFPSKYWDLSRYRTTGPVKTPEDILGGGG